MVIQIGPDRYVHVETLTLLRTTPRHDGLPMVERISLERITGEDAERVIDTIQAVILRQELADLDMERQRYSSTELINGEPR